MCYQSVNLFDWLNTARGKNVPLRETNFAFLPFRKCLVQRRNSWLQRFENRSEGVYSALACFCFCALGINWEPCEETEQRIKSGCVSGSVSQPALVDREHRPLESPWKAPGWGHLQPDRFRHVRFLLWGIVLSGTLTAHGKGGAKMM